jgi:FkbM family methyltransferase
MKGFINKLLGKFDVQLTRKSSYETFLSRREKYGVYELAELIDSVHLPVFFESLQYSKAQLRQDIFVLSELGFKREGYFVEFGATNGVDLSNSYLLEKQFGWNGVLAEPARKWHFDLGSNRKVNIEHDCVWTNTGEKLLFNEVDYGELSTIDSFSDSDVHRKSRMTGIKYEVNTISLNHLLDKYSAPKEIDYLSIDTEGSEFKILKAFDFSKYKFNVITCEHNFTPMRQQIYTLLSKNGYKRKLTELSSFDDWYIPAD